MEKIKPVEFQKIRRLIHIGEDAELPDQVVIIKEIKQLTTNILDNLEEDETD